MGAETFPTAFLFLVAGCILPLLPRGLPRAALLIAVPVIAAGQVLVVPAGGHQESELFGFTLQLMRVDALSRVFALIFCIAAFLGNLYAWHVRDLVQQTAALLYAGSAIGAVFAGDLVTLFIYWEGTALASVFLIWARRTPGAFHTGMRYLAIQIGSGVLLLAGVILLHRETQSIAFDRMTLGSLATWLIFIAFGIKCAFPLLHNWLQDSYPAATVTGTVILSAFTTKLAVYSLARGFPGTEILIYIGTLMTIFPIFFAEIENDLRRVLAYSLNNQLGFMVVGIGIGTEMALNGTVSHAFAHILYKALLFMSVGAVLFRTGTSKASELGGLYRTMPLTALCCVIGAASISAFPLFSGFVTKSLILHEVEVAHMTVIWLGLVFASAGVLSHSGIKVPYFAFFAHDSGRRPAEAPPHMLLAMGLTAFLCVFIGVHPGPLYELLPYPVHYDAYTVPHVVGQLELLLFAMLAFCVLMRTGIHPPEVRAVNLDFDWTYRRFIPSILTRVLDAAAGASDVATGWLRSRGRSFADHLYHSRGPENLLGRSWPTGSMALFIVGVLVWVLIITFLSGF